MNILHLATDEKFIDMALSSFERVFPNSNSLYVYTTTPDNLNYIKSNIDKVISKKERHFGLNVNTLKKFDVVVVHSLSVYFKKIILKIPNDIIVVWLGWGFDYYRYLDGFQYYLPITNAILAERNAERQSIKSLILNRLRIMTQPSEHDVISRIDYFSPVLESEYFLIKQAKTWKKFPKKFDWNYGNLEDDFTKSEYRWVDKFNILVGNSASATNNHLDLFNLLKRFDLHDNKVIVPLSYGNSDWQNLIIREGREVFKDNFEPLTTFMHVDKYLALLRSCSVVIMNHTRQQALGTVIMMLYLGAKLYLNESNPMFSFLKNNNISIYSTNLLENDTYNLFSQLTKDERENNRSAIQKIWSRAVCDDKTLSLRGLIDDRFINN